MENFKNPSLSAAIPILKQKDKPASDITKTPFLLILKNFLYKEKLSKN